MYLIKKTGRLMSQYDCSGYKAVKIDGKSERVHILLARAFIPNPDNKPYIDHINRCTFDNRLCNLRWVTYSENCINHSKTGGESGHNGIYKITSSDGHIYWVANISFNRKRLTQRFEYSEDGLLKAIQKRKYWEKLYHKEYSPNIIDETIEDVPKKLLSNNKSGHNCISKTTVKNKNCWRYYKKINGKVHCKDFPYTDEGLKRAIDYKQKAESIIEQVPFVV